MNIKKNPLVTFALISYNNEKYIEEAVKSALSQTYERLQIVISDDGSSDSTFEIILNLVNKYKGNKEVKTYNNTKNLGIGAHINKIMENSDGELIVIAAGDDISEKNRVEEIINHIQNSQNKIYSVWSSANYIDEVGIKINKRFPGSKNKFTDRRIVKNIRPVIGATHAWRSEVFQFFGPLNDKIVFEDNAISFRSYLLGEIKYIDRKLVNYRIHNNNLANFKVNNNINELYKMASIRNQWAIIGINQRESDLYVAREKELITSKKYKNILNALEKEKKRVRKRIYFYEKFPEISIKLIMQSMNDFEVLKIFIRTIKYKIININK